MFFLFDPAVPPMYIFTMTNTTEGSMTKSEINNEIENLQGNVNASIHYLILLQNVATERGTLHLYPVFEDSTIKTLLKDYRQLMELRGY